jgi:hypothetical protein
MKKDGGTITDWQIHNLGCTKEQIEEVFPGQNAKPMVMTGTIVDDPTGRWEPGYHMRSSLVVNIDREKGIVETVNTIYKVSGTEGADIFKDLGDSIMNIFY